MAETLVERVRYAVGIGKNDEFFRDTDIRDYLNASQHKVISYLIQNELNAKDGRPMRALDKLRDVVTVNAGSASSYGGYQFYDFVLDLAGGDPADGIQEMLYVSFLDYSTQRFIRGKELPMSKLFMLDWGNIRPSKFESYYFTHTTGDTEIALRVFAESIDNTTNNEDRVVVNVIKEPTEITTTTETLTELPTQFTNAVIYGAAVMMGVQEKSENVQDVMELYKKELEKNAY
jgi:hypothetical protein